MTTSPSRSIFLCRAYLIFFSSFLAFLELSLAFGPLLGSRPGLAPRRTSLGSILLRLASSVWRRSFLALEARATRRFLQAKLGFLTDMVGGRNVVRSGGSERWIVRRLVHVSTSLEKVEVGWEFLSLSLIADKGT